MNELKVERTAGIVAVEIRSLTAQAQRIGFSYAIEIGRRLVEAKSLLKHGEWGNWLKNEIDYSQSSANKFMKIFEDYGAKQLGFITEAKSESITNLSYTKALKLLALPEDDRDELIESGEAERLSNRELEAAIRERNAAREEAEKVSAEIKAAREETDRLRRELEAEKSRPVETVPAINEDKIRADAEKKAKAEISSAVSAEKKKFDERVEKALRDAENATAERVAKLEDAYKAAAEHAAELEKRAQKVEAEAKSARLAAASASPEVAQYQIVFADVQAKLNQLSGLILKAPEDKRDGLRRALAALCDKVKAAIV